MDQHRDRKAAGAGAATGAGIPHNRQQGPAILTQDLPSHPPINCPRCDSSNTKFCYYNNYSQTQPRHFCKNCRRYWTQGGTLRNVPIGGGCRKNKRVRPRSLLPIGGLHEVGLPPFSVDAASHMFGRLSNIPNFDNGSSNIDMSNDVGRSQLLNIAFARFQESMRLHQQSPQSSEAAPFSDMSLPALVHKPCALSTCTGGPTCANRASHLHLNAAACGDPGVVGDGLDKHSGFTTFHPQSVGFCNNSFDIANPAVYASTSRIHNIMGTSATATLASIEDELSSFSNLQYNVNPFHAGAGQEHNDFNLSAAQAGRSQRLATVPHLEHRGRDEVRYIANNGQQTTNADLASKQYVAPEVQGLVREEKPMMGGVNGLSLMMCADDWHQAASTDEMQYEPHEGMLWSSNATRWQDMHSAMASSAAAAGSAL